MRFSPPTAGSWVYRTESPTLRALDGLRGKFSAQPASQALTTHTLALVLTLALETLGLALALDLALALTQALALAPPYSLSLLAPPYSLSLIISAV